MLNSSGIVEIDVHGRTAAEAKKQIDCLLRNAGGAVYRIRVIHGYHGGTRISQMVSEEYSYGRHEKVKRVQGGNNPGITELVLREL